VETCKFSLKVDCHNKCKDKINLRSQKVQIIALCRNSFTRKNNYIEKHDKTNSKYLESILTTLKSKNQTYTKHKFSKSTNSHF